MSDADSVRSALRTAVLNGTYAPNQRLIETELAEQYSVSRFVIRTALMQLVADGLVEIQPNRGARVRAISVDEAIEITEIRRAVEGLVAARAAERVTAEQAESLRDLSAQMQAAVESNELLRYSDLNAALHARLRDIASHAGASRIIEQLNGQMVRHQFMLSLVPGRPSISLPEHQAIIEAVRRRDPTAAESAMRTHITSVMDALSTSQRRADEAAARAQGGY